jgi:hypothetical protein
LICGNGGAIAHRHIAADRRSNEQVGPPQSWYRFAGIAKGAILRNSHLLAASPLAALLLAGPAAAFSVDCSAEPNLHSVSSVTSGDITFTNNSGGTVQIFWLDYNGARTPYAALQPGQTFTSSTFVSHPWVAAAPTGQCLSIFFLGNGATSASVTNPYGVAPTNQFATNNGFASAPPGINAVPGSSGFPPPNVGVPPIPPLVVGPPTVGVVQGPPNAVPPGVNGRNVTSVATTSSSFLMVGPGRWAEVGKGGQFNFVENNRDDWSVYLSDASRGVQLQLDLFQRQVNYSDGKSPKRPLYAVTGAAADVNGHNVVVVTVPAARYSVSGPGTWIEQGNNGSRFNFVETNRDDWSVYLSDASRGVQLQIDLYRRQIFYSDTTSPQRPLYPISNTSAFPT